MVEPGEEEKEKAVRRAWDTGRLRIERQGKGGRDVRNAGAGESGDKEASTKLICNALSSG